MTKFSFTISAHVGNHIAIRYLCFKDIYPCCIHKQMHLIKLVVFFLILHVVTRREGHLRFIWTHRRPFHEAHATVQ
jgi:hypothetical protein